MNFISNTASPGYASYRSLIFEFTGSMFGQTFVSPTIMRSYLMTTLPFRIMAFVTILRCNLFPTSCRGLLKDIQGGRENTVSFTVSTKLPKNQCSLHLKMLHPIPDSRFFLHMWAKIPGVRGKLDRLFMFIVYIDIIV